MVLANQRLEDSSEEIFNPKILGFVCNWCSYVGADSAGQLHYNYPVNVRLIRTMCSGRVDPQMLFDALKIADVIFIAGCHLPNDCHYKTGNHFARTRVIMMQQLLENLGLHPDRIQILFISPSEGKEFSKAMKELKELGINLGPNPIHLEEKLSKSKEQT